MSPALPRHGFWPPGRHWPTPGQVWLVSVSRQDQLTRTVEAPSVGLSIAPLLVQRPVAVPCCGVSAVPLTVSVKFAAMSSVGLFGSKSMSSTSILTATVYVQWVWLRAKYGSCRQPSVPDPVTTTSLNHGSVDGVSL